MTIIENSIDEYKKLSNNKQMFVLGFMQGVLFNNQEEDGQEQESKFPVM